MADLYLVALGGDVVLSTVIFTNYLNEPTHSNNMVIAAAFSTCLVANFLFMNATPVEMTFHAVVGTAFAWALAPWLKESFLYLKKFLPE